MKAMIMDAGSPAGCYPITCARLLADCPVANRPLVVVQKVRLEEGGFKVVEKPGRAAALWVRGDAWLSVAVISGLARAEGPVAVRDEQGEILAWIGDKEGHVVGGGEEIKADGETFRIRYAWDLLRVNEYAVGELCMDRVEGEVSPAATVEGRLVLGKGSRVLPGVYIEGKVMIGADCKVGPNCYIRGNTSIGDGCHIGQAVEIKNSIVMKGSSIGHLSYCGDSIIGEGVNFGAGTITSNFRHDGGNHRSMVGGGLVDTGRIKFGAVVGDHVHTGIHTAIYPGRKLWPGVSTRPGAVVQRDVE
jgi:carbonic anhydrase/acetyltransferase-like protein (isoleucine patch superfamily)